jgi:putative colanic acid biosynthesis UDP-glucose lipid carrier transferase
LKKPNPLEFVGNGYAFFYRFVDISVLITAFIMVCHYFNLTIDKNYLILMLIHVLFFSYIAEGLQLYRSWRAGRFSQMLRLCIGVLFISFALMILCLFSFNGFNFYHRGLLLSWLALSACSLVAWRYFSRWVRTIQRERGINLQKVAIVGMTERGIQLYHELQQHPELGFECIGFYDDRDAERLPADYRHLLQGNVNEAVLTAQANVISRLYICLPLQAEKRIHHMIQILGDTTLDVYLVPDLLYLNMLHGRVGSVGEIDTISVFESPHYGVQMHLKRTFDVCFAGAALIGLAPVMLLIALLVKLTSKGPVFFVQDRYGLDGRKIGVYKFRSMKVMENSSTVVQATRNDPRVTPIGGFLRRSSLDELPQFINVLKGDMSVVGPRPHAVAHNEHYRNKVSFYMLRHKVKPGITGWAQINGWRGETDTIDKMQKRVEYDLHYIRHWTLWWDVKIILKTLFKGFGGKHVY